MRASAVQRILGMLHQGVKRVMKCLWVLYHCSHAISWGFTFQTGSVQSYQFNDTTRVIVTWSYLQVLQSSMESSNHPLSESWTMWSHLSGHRDFPNFPGLGPWKWVIGRDLWTRSGIVTPIVLVMITAAWKWGRCRLYIYRSVIDPWM